MSSDTILVIGATGQLGGTIARQLLEAARPVRVMSRTPDRLAPLVSLGAQPVGGDLRDAASLERACAGVAQVVTTANNVMGAGATSPNRVDLAGYRTLCSVVARMGGPRLVHLSARGLTRDNPVDFFRVKYAVDEAIRGCGVPWVLVQPSAFMETWVSQILGDGMRTQGVATLFGDGSQRCNFIAIDDVATFVVRILADAAVRNEVVQVGGPSTLSFEEVARCIDRALGTKAKRRHVPLPVLRWAPALVRHFNEVTARLMSLGYWSAVHDASFAEWEVAARRFGVAPIGVEQYVAAHFTSSGPSGVPPR